jgi:hypothetical protein
MGFLKKLGIPNADALEEQMKSRMNPVQSLKSNPVTAGLQMGRLAKANGKLGSMEVPGETSLLLQAGKVRLTFSEGGDSAQREMGSNFIQPKFPGFEVTLSGGGEPLPVHWYPPNEIAVKTGGVPPKSKSLVGEVEIPGTGEYVFRAPEPVPDLELLDGAKVKRQGSLLID